MKPKTVFGVLVVYVLLLVVIVIFFSPLYWLVSTSFKDTVDIFTTPPKIVGFHPTLQNYAESFSPQSSTSQFHHLVNSVVVALFNALLSTFLGALVAYHTSFFQSKYKGFVLFWILSLRMLPPVVFAVPFYLGARALGLLDTRLSLVLVYCLLNVPLSVWVLRSFFMEIPLELREAALVDGAGEYTIFFRLILPLATSGLVVTFLLSTIFSWNEMLLALVLTSTNAETMPVGMTTYWNSMQINWGAFAAAGTAMFLPVMALALGLQKWLVRGLTFGAIK